MNKLEALKKHTIIVADTGDIDSIKELRPEDATTNPSLILKAMASGKYNYLLDDALLKVEKDNLPDSFVITSYSIHYTKLYESPARRRCCNRPGWEHRNCRRPGRGRRPGPRHPTPRRACSRRRSASGPQSHR